MNIIEFIDKLGYYEYLSMHDENEELRIKYKVISDYMRKKLELLLNNN